MTKDEAREILNDYLTKLAADDFEYRVTLPVSDALIHGPVCFDVPQTIKQYTFRHLLKIVYDLKD